MNQSPTSEMAAVIARIPYAAYLGVQIAHDSHGLLFHLPFANRLVGNTALPAIHGGVVAGFLENAALLQVMLAEPQQPRMPKTIDFSVDYLRSAGPRDTYARCSIARLGWRVAQVQVQSWQEDSTQPVAVARAHFLLEAMNAPEVSPAMPNAPV